MTKLSKELPLDTNQEEPTDQADVLKSQEHPSETCTGINGEDTKQSPKKEEIGETVQQSDQVDISTEPEDHQLSLPSKELTDESSTPSPKDGSSFSLKTIWRRMKKSDEAKEKKKERTEKTDMSTEERPAPRGFRAFFHRVRRFFGGCCRRGNRTTGLSRAGSQAPQEEPNAEANSNTEPTDEQQAATSTPQMTLDSFNFHQILGEGAFGKGTPSEIGFVGQKVVLASHSATNQQYAVKVVHKWPLAKMPTLVPIERNVLRIVSDNRFFIHAFGTFQTENHLFYVLDYASGGDLNDFIKARAPMDLDTVRFLSAELLSGLMFLHSKGIVHRDMKPQNILLDSAGHIKIGDFGIAEINMFRKTKIRQYAGTLVYMAPEVLCYVPHNAMLDYYSLGVIVYKMATKKYPTNINWSIDNLKQSPCESAPSPPAYLDAHLRDFTERLLCRDQEERREHVRNIKKHPLFNDINWEELEAGKVEPPFKMHLTPVSLKEMSLEQVMTPCNRQQNPLLPTEQELFDGFTFISDQWKRM